MYGLWVKQLLAFREHVLFAPPWSRSRGLLLVGSNFPKARASMLKQPLLSPLFSPSREPHFVTQCFMNEETEAKEGFCNHPGSKCESFDTHPKTGLHYIATKSRCLKFSVLCAFPHLWKSPHSQGGKRRTIRFFHAHRLLEYLQALGTDLLKG